MYLSQLVLNPRCRQVRRDLGDVHEMHRTVMSAFPRAANGQARAELGVLFRIEPNRHDGGNALLVQSEENPDWSDLPSDYLLPSGSATESKPIKEVYRHLRDEQILRFRLRANVTKKVDTKSGPDGKRRNGRRIEVRDEAGQIIWLQRRAAAAGFQLLPARANSAVPEVRVKLEDQLIGRRRRTDQQNLSNNDRRITVRPVLFEGILQIIDAEKFRSALRIGVGPGKAYGCGLLSVAALGNMS